MTPSVTDLLSTLSTTPNWKYQLGLAQLGPQEQENTYQYQLGQSQLAQQMAQFQQQQALAQAQQQFAQQLAQQQQTQSSQAQQFGEQQTGQQNALTNWLTQLFGPSQAIAQIAAMTGGAGKTAPGMEGVSTPNIVTRPGQTFNPAAVARNPGLGQFLTLSNSGGI
jgi:hypothetical protein